MGHEDTPSRFLYDPPRMFIGGSCLSMPPWQPSLPKRLVPIKPPSPGDPEPSFRRLPPPPRPPRAPKPTDRENEMSNKPTRVGQQRKTPSARSTSRRLKWAARKERWVKAWSIPSPPYVGTNPKPPIELNGEPPPKGCGRPPIEL